jgi:hypothetical protein
LNVRFLQSGSMPWTNYLGVTVICVAVAAWGCSQSSKVAQHDDDHDDDHCLCHEGHDHDHAHHAHASLEEIKKQLAKLSDEDRKLAEAQGFCAVRTSTALGSMGVPFKLVIDGRPVFLCCEHCQETALKDPKATLAAVDELLPKHLAQLPSSVK